MRHNHRAWPLCRTVINLTWWQRKHHDCRAGPILFTPHLPGPVSLWSLTSPPVSQLGQEGWATGEREPGSVLKEDAQDAILCPPCTAGSKMAPGGGREEGQVRATRWLDTWLRSIWQALGDWASEQDTLRTSSWLDTGVTPRWEPPGDWTQEWAHPERVGDRNGRSTVSGEALIEELEQRVWVFLRMYIRRSQAPSSLALPEIALWDCHWGGGGGVGGPRSLLSVTAPQPARSRLLCLMRSLTPLQFEAWSGCCAPPAVLVLLWVGAAGSSGPWWTAPRSPWRCWTQLRASLQLHVQPALHWEELAAQGAAPPPFHYHLPGEIGSAITHNRITEIGIHPHCNIFHSAWLLG